MKCLFQQGCWSMEGLTHAYSTRFPAMPEFAQREDCIENVQTPVSKDGYAYVSLLTKEKLHPVVKLSTRCAFEGTAAPLVVLAKALEEKEGKLFYGDYLEVVLYEKGINVWSLWTAEDGSVKIRNLLRLFRPVETGAVHDFSLKILEDRFVIELDGQVTDLYCGEIFDAFHLGITGCEGPCRFYHMEIE